ncbi:TPA: ribonuclease III [Candidatus Uhrbacteria bacterium]|uniref:Ribonuclease 3 n=2 Tax=Candidatus Uhriibacteriota TaxID=1752732 RepID=A0A0G1Q7B4_9BACT|nr:MAG: Ribonuclease 3 [Candidatus Uhrbacteria bacterium GW2011_GWF2_46_218]KKU40727.1 MAG: Ribonuclease 3 [Candidatus Uhrbacteria bacterium GW2011_GWE2_46_68]HBK33589.1 ribonuclease III [Candidatus Uhrbacteria bacterium]HCB19696.1 ribonuclease III [Candidatus Uhrbacteria bacterium]
MPVRIKEPIEKAIGVTFKNKDLIRQAVVHRSYLNEHPDFPLGHNERLEFLGDAVLELIVTEYLYEKYENPEGELTNWRAALVNADMLSSICSEMEVEEYLFLSKGEAKDKNTKARRYILANAFEAIIGAIYLDQGWDKSKEFIHTHVLCKLPHILEHRLYIDPKSRFQEASQERAGITPSYKVLSEEGPDHEKIFDVGVYIGKELVATGKGMSKQEAQVAAAEKGLEVKDWK